MKILLIISLLILSQATWAELNERQVAELLKYNVVSLSVRMQNGDSEQGFGWIIGQQLDRLYIVTADHVVRGEDRLEVPDVIDVRLFADPTDSHIGILSTASSFKNLDIALLTIKSPNRQPWLYSAISTETEMNIPVSFVGKSKEWMVPSESGTLSDTLLASETQNMDYDLIAHGLAAEVGTSGAPLISKNGIVGMIVEHSSEGTAVVSLQEIKKMVVEESKIKWGLLPFSTPFKLEGKWAPKTANIPAEIRLEFSPIDTAHFDYKLSIPGEKTYSEGIGVVDGETVRMWQPLTGGQESYGTFAVHLDDNVSPAEVVLMHGELAHGNLQPTRVRLAKLKDEQLDPRAATFMLENPNLIEKLASRLQQAAKQNGTDEYGIPLVLNDDDAAMMSMGVVEGKLIPVLYDQMAQNGISDVKFSIRNISAQSKCLVAKGLVSTQKQKDTIEAILSSTAQRASQQLGNTYDICNETSIPVNNLASVGKSNFDFAAELIRPQALMDAMMPGIELSVEGECLLVEGNLTSPMFRSLLTKAMSDLAQQLSDKSNSNIVPCDKTTS